MKIAVFKDTAAIAGKPVMDAFIKSLKGEDYVVCKNTQRPDADVIVIWSVLLNMYGRNAIYQYYKHRAKILVIEVGGLLRNKTWRIGIGGINASADFANQNIAHVDDSRAVKMGIKCKEWTTPNDSSPFYICLQNTKSEAWTGGDVDNWLKDIIEHIRYYTDRKILIRQHPRHNTKIDHVINYFPNVSESRPVFTEGDKVDFVKKLSEAYCVVNYNSNPAIEAVMNGVPVMVSDSSLCKEVGNTFTCDVNNLKRPDRTHWLNKISYCEWYVDEIALGIPWRRLKPRMQGTLSSQWSGI